MSVVDEALMINPFLKPSEALERSKFNRRSIDPSKVCKYHIKPLDDSLVGFLPSDLIVIGADSGTGKSVLANHIAYENAKRGMNVFLFSLEGDEDEVYNRLKWKHICENYYKNEMWKHGRPINMSYGLYATNQLDISDLEDIAESVIHDELKDNLKIFNRSFDMTSKTIINALEWQIDTHRTEPDEKYVFGKQITKCKADIIIIDHLHYFELEGSQSEIQETTLILKNLKKYAQEFKVPIVLVSHLRKKGKDRGMPDVDDLHGSSNISKISSGTILITPNFSEYDLSTKRYGTFIRIAKSRVEIKPNMAIHLYYNGRIGAYEDEYEIYNINMQNKPEELDRSKWPGWARS